MRRRGFTLIELLVVMGIIAALATMLVVLAPAFGDRQRSSRGASMLQSWLNLAKQRAIRDRRPVGIRLPSLPAGTYPYISELQYVEVPDEGIGGTATVPYASNYPPPGMQNPPGQYQCVLLTTTTFFTPGDPTATLQPGDMIEFTDRPLGNYAPRRILGVSKPSTLNPGPGPTPPPPPQDSVTSNGVTYYNYFILLDASLPSANFSTQTFVVSRKARPVVGEPVLQLPKDVAIDIDRDFQNLQPTWYRMFPPTANNGGTNPFDILFSPAGQVIGTEGNLGSRICLWVRDLSLNSTGPNVGNDANRTDPTALPPGVNTLITVYTRTGHVTSHPVDPSGLLPNTSAAPNQWNPFSFTQDGLTSGNAGN
jgi:prepilin-type N-terminal cleavage/methylation domain-containing protein